MWTFTELSSLGERVDLILEMQNARVVLKSDHTSVWILVSALSCCIILEKLPSLGNLDFLSVKIKENAYFIGGCIHILFLRFFFIWTIFKGFIEFVTILLLCHVLVFLALKHVGFSTPCMLACMCMLSHVWLCNPTDCNLPGFSVHGILQASILEWVDITFAGQGSNPHPLHWKVKY